MTKERSLDAQKTFRARAASYERESSWVRDVDLIDPLFGGLRAGGSIADVCSGTGSVGSRASTLGFLPVAFDLSLDMLHASELTARVAATGSALPLRDKCVDRVVCRQGLHYLDIDKAIREFMRVGRSVSIGTITMFAATDAPFWERYFNVASPGRLRVFAPAEVRGLLESYGLTIIDETVIKDRGSLLGPIRHLGKEVCDQFTAEFLGSAQSSYEVRVDVDDLTYAQRWELVVAHDDRDDLCFERLR